MIDWHAIRWTPADSVWKGDPLCLSDEWCAIHRGYLGDQRVASIEEAYDVAAEFLDVFLEDRNLVADRAVAEGTWQRRRGENHIDTFVRRGRYRVDVYGLTRAMIKDWTRRFAEEPREGA